MNPSVSDVILVVAHSIERARTIRESINLRGFDSVECMVMSDFSQKLDDPSHLQADLLMLDPEGSYNEALGLMNRLPSNLPVLFFAESFNEELFLNTFDAGAKDFMVKPVSTSYLVSRVLIALDACRLQGQLRQRTGLLKELSVVGIHSGLLTTAFFLKALQEAVQEMISGNLPCLSVLMIELDDVPVAWRNHPDFKKVVYREISTRLSQCCRGSDILGEYFQDKFAAVLPGTNLAGTRTLSHRLEQHLNGIKVPIGDDWLTLSIRMGTADFGESLNADDMLNRAMHNLNQAFRQETHQA